MNSKAVKITDKREKAKENAFLNDFDGMNVKNFVMEVNLKGKDVEYEINMNPRYAKKEDEFYNNDLSEEESVRKKAEGNFNRLMQIINNANENFTMNFQYIVFHKELVNDIRKWLDSLIPLSAHLKYGKIDEDIVELKKIFPKIEKEWLVIDGNSYFSTIHSIYLAKNKSKYKYLSDDIKYWSKYYARIPSKGKGYTNKNISSNEYIKSIQMIQLISLVLEQNLYSWPLTDKNLFLERLHRITYAVVYRESQKRGTTSIKDVCSTFQAVKYLILSNERKGEYNVDRKMDACTFFSLFSYNGDLDNCEQLNQTCYNIKIFKQLVHGTITKQGNHLNYGKAMDILNEIYRAETEYQNLSMTPIKGVESIQARDRCNKANSFLSKTCFSYSAQLKKDIISNELSIIEIRGRLAELVNCMIDDYEKFLIDNANKLRRNNKKGIEEIQSLYKIYDINRISEAEFTKVITDIIESIK